MMGEKRTNRTSFCLVCVHQAQSSTCARLAASECAGAVEDLRGFAPVTWCPACGGLLGHCGCFFEIVGKGDEAILIPYAENTSPETKDLNCPKVMIDKAYPPGMVEALRSLPSTLEARVPMEQLLATSVLSVVRKVTGGGQDLFAMFCTLVNYQIDIVKFLIPMLDGFATVIAERYGNDFTRFLRAPRETQARLINSFPWSYTNARGKPVPRTGWNHRFKTTSDLLCIMHKLAAFADGTSFQAKAKALFEAAPSFKAFVEQLIGIFHDTSSCSGCKACKTDEDKAAMAQDHFMKAQITSQSCVKKYLLFLRWMVRPYPDTALWTFIPASRLLVPIDIIVKRIMARLGVVSKEDGCVWKDVQTITDLLRRVDPDDPIAVDFAISRIGFLDICQHDVAKSRCGECPLAAHCIVKA